MPIHYARALTAPTRSQRANRHLGFALAFVAGASNAGGYLAVRQYTSHMTGIVTDIGIEIGKLLYWNRDGDGQQPRVEANRPRLTLLCGLLASFLAGGVFGAWGFKHAGYVATLPLAALLCLLAIVPALDDLRRFAHALARRSG